MVDNEYKLVATNIEKGTFELFNLKKDRTESIDISEKNPKKFEQLKSEFNQWNKSLKNSIEGMDYPEKMVSKGEPERHFWMDDPKYEIFIKKHGERPEYSGSIKNKKKNQ